VKNNFRLDSICPTGSGKVAGVKIEIHEEKWADGAEGDPPSPEVSAVANSYGGASRRDKLARFELGSAGINGVGREKAPSGAKGMEGRQEERPPSQSFGATSWRDLSWVPLE
jgi:hypothetical protein